MTNDQFYCKTCIEFFDTEEQVSAHKIECDASEAKRKEKWSQFVEAYTSLLAEYDVELEYIYAEGTEHTIDGRRIPHEWENRSL